MKTNHTYFQQNTPDSLSADSGNTVLKQQNGDTGIKKTDTVLPITPPVIKDTFAKSKEKQPDSSAKKEVIPPAQHNPELAKKDTLVLFEQETVVDADTVIGQDSAININPEIESFEAFSEQIFPGLQPVPKTENESALIAGIVILNLSLIAWVKANYSRRMAQLYEAFLTNRFIRQWLREDVVFSSRIHLVLSAVFVSVYATFAMIATAYFFPEQINNAIGFYIKAFLSIAAFFSLKVFFIRFSGILFKKENEFAEYNFNLLLFNQFGAFILLPVIIFSAYFEPKNDFVWVCSGGFVLSLLFVIRLLKMFFLSFTQTGFYRLYIFLYICTLEILPLIVLLKVIIS